MNIPVEIITAFLVAMLGLQGWTLTEIIALKMKMVKLDDLEKRVTNLEHKRKHE